MANNVDLTREAFAAQAEGDLGPAQALIVGEAAIHVPAALGLGELRGVDGMASLILELLSRCEGNFASSLVDAIGRGDLVTTLNEVTASRGGQAMTYNTVWTFRFQEEKVVEAWLHPSRPEEEIADFYGFSAPS